MDKKVDVLNAPKLIVIGYEGQLKVTDASPKRMWLWGGRLGEKSRWIDHILIQGANFCLSPARGGVISDGAFKDAFTGERKIFYCRILADDVRSELHQLDVRIDEAEKKLAAVRGERQDFLAACARRGTRVPTPPPPPKPQNRKE